MLLLKAAPILSLVVAATNAHTSFRVDNERKLQQGGPMPRIAALEALNIGARLDALEALDITTINDRLAALEALDITAINDRLAALEDRVALLEACPGGCDDGNPCTTGDYCDVDLGCINEPQVGMECDDGNPCTVDDECRAYNGDSAHVYCSGTPRVCEPEIPPDGDPQCYGDAWCVVETDVSGNVNWRCETQPLWNGTPCDDGDPCTTDVSCQDGRCVGTPLTCANGSCGSDGCVCNAGYMNCDYNIFTGCETYVNDNPNHCGACHVYCPSGVCTDGVCVE